ncbi:hypothetical protein GWK47_038589 [Chionoecetes opilio]|uniref:Uncharacterized protein n=1 Tax=Chionoecetes opilio TaxID=41210 RepID=A0A8J4YDZ7_CHIOP|nr:hypothetical protein GWK47_038589 [Chionoecetes opilio]
MRRRIRGRGRRATRRAKGYAVVHLEKVRLHLHLHHQEQVNLKKHYEKMHSCHAFSNASGRPLMGRARGLPKAREDESRPRWGLVQQKTCLSKDAQCHASVRHPRAALMGASKRMPKARGGRAPHAKRGGRQLCLEESVSRQGHMTPDG